MTHLCYYILNSKRSVNLLSRATVPYSNKPQT
jgi:hypothetical protein